jgi:hypothetical protein
LVRKPKIASAAHSQAYSRRYVDEVVSVQKSLEAAVCSVEDLLERAPHALRVSNGMVTVVEQVGRLRRTLLAYLDLAGEEADGQRELSGGVESKSAKTLLLGR